jgi:hypothetical protein
MRRIRQAGKQLRNNCKVSKLSIESSLQVVTPEMYLSGVQFRACLDSRLKHAGMTDFGEAIHLTRQVGGQAVETRLFSESFASFGR